MLVWPAQIVIKPKWALTRAYECTRHSYAWSGNIPCTGMYRCVYCGKPKDEHSFNGA